MKRARVLLSSSSSEESSPAKSAGRSANVNQMADEDDMIVDGEVTVKDPFVQLNMMKRNFERNFSGLRSDIKSYRPELQNDFKSLNDRVDEIQLKMLGMKSTITNPIWSPARKTWKISGLLLSL